MRYAGFSETILLTITLDDYHVYGRTARKKIGITPLSPEANDLAGLERDIALLKSGKAIRKKRYNHETGTFEGPFIFEPKKIIFFEGLHTLFTPRLRELLDFSLFVDPDPMLNTSGKGRGIPGHADIQMQKSVPRSRDGRLMIRGSSPPRESLQMP